MKQGRELQRKMAHEFRGLVSATLLLFLLFVSITFSSFPANLSGNLGSVLLSSSNDSKQALLSTALPTRLQTVLPNNEAIVGASLEMFAYNPSTIQTTIANIAANGATGVRIFSAWSNIEPSPGQYNTATILAAVQAALSHNMTIILNLNDHGIPSWFQSQFSNFVTNQTGGYVKNWNTITPSLADTGETKAWFDVVGNISQTIANNFGVNNPKIVIGVTNEDHYTNAVREIGDYSLATVNAWRTWLSQSFGNDIGNFNNAVNGSFASYDAVQPPIDTSNVQLWYYWRYLTPY